MGGERSHNCAIPAQSPKSKRSDSFFLGRDFAIWSVSMETVTTTIFVLFAFESPSAI